MLGCLLVQHGLLLRVRLAIEVLALPGLGALEKALEKPSFAPRDQSAFFKIGAGNLSPQLLLLTLVHETYVELS
jgi:hypothetical protein